MSMAPELAAAGGAGHVAYVVLVALHVVAAVVGFGSVALSGAYAPVGSWLDTPAGREEAARWFQGSTVAEWALVAVPVAGGAALGVQPGGKGIGQVWAGLALVLWCVASFLLLRVVRPAERRIGRLLAAPVGPDGSLDGDAAAGARRAARSLRAAAVGCDVVFVVALVLMVWKPG